MNRVDIDKLAGGAVAERFNEAFKKVMENIADPNTDHKITRKVTLELTFAASEDRCLSQVSVTAKTKLAPQKSVATKFLIDRDMGSGEILATEFKNQIPGQTYIKVPYENPKVDESTGEIIEDSEEQQSVETVTRKELRAIK